MEKALPVENERKYVLDNITPSMFDETYWVKKELKQGYLNKRCRIREYDVDGINSYVFTYKKTIEDEIIEIETDISKEDFDKLWTAVKTQLVKTRYSERECGANLWEIDFFGDANNPYFVMAEWEIFNGDDTPYQYPTELTGKIIYNVERNDKRFTSKSLTNEENAAILYNTLKEANYG